MLYVFAPIVVALGLCLFALWSKIIGWVYSHTLKWPVSCSPSQQARICSMYFRRAGLRAFGPPAAAVVWDMVAGDAPNELFISFGSFEKIGSDSYWRDIIVWTPGKRGGNVVAVMASDVVTPAALHYSQYFKVPVFNRSDLPRIRAEMVKRPANLRAALLAISPAFQIQVGGPPTNHTAT